MSSELVAQVSQALGEPERAAELKRLATRVAPYPLELVGGQEVVADFYGGETKHGRELRLHSGGAEVGREVRARWLGGLGRPLRGLPAGHGAQAGLRTSRGERRRSEKKQLDLVHRSLAPWRRWVHTDDGRFPHHLNHQHQHESTQSRSARGLIYLKDLERKPLQP